MSTMNYKYTRKYRGRKYIIVLLLLFYTCGICITVNAEKSPRSSGGFEPFVYRNGRGETLPYRLLKPIDNRRGIKYPLILYLHGSFEKGTDNIKQLGYIADVFEKPAWRREYPCFILAPQSPPRQNWVFKESYSGTVKQSPRPTGLLRSTMELVRWVQKEYNVDPDRIYIIGISSGGSGVWDAVTRYPKFFAAAVPFCGSGDTAKAPLIARLPVWVFHGRLDLVVNPKCSRLMVEAMKKSGGNPRYTEYPESGHMCWIRAFRDRSLFQWLFAQVRGVAP